jgi:hypothetical protein
MFGHNVISAHAHFAVDHVSQNMRTKNSIETERQTIRMRLPLLSAGMSVTEIP